MLDIMSAILQKLYGTTTEQDFDAYEKAAGELLLIWKALDLHYTPSVHYVHKEAITPFMASWRNC